MEMLQLTVGPARSSLVVRVVGLVGCLAVVALHVIDQGGVPGSKGPDYVQILYYLLEVAGVVAAALLLGRLARVGWLLSLGVAVGPILGYVLSRGPGLPDYTDAPSRSEPLGPLGDHTSSTEAQPARRPLALTATADAYSHVLGGSKGSQ